MCVCMCPLQTHSSFSSSSSSSSSCSMKGQRSSCSAALVRRSALCSDSWRSTKTKSSILYAHTRTHTYAVRRKSDSSVLQLRDSDSDTSAQPAGAGSTLASHTHVKLDNAAKRGAETRARLEPLANFRRARRFKRQGQEKDTRCCVSAAATQSKQATPHRESSLTHLLSTARAKQAHTPAQAPAQAPACHSRRSRLALLRSQLPRQPSTAHSHPRDAQPPRQ